MAYVADFVTTIVRAGAECSQAFLGARSLVSSVYQNVDLNELGVKGKTVSFPFPTLPSVADDAAGSPTYNSPASSAKSVTLSQMPAVNFKISDWEQLQANPVELREVYVDPALKAIYKYLNAQIATLITAANFDSYTPIPHDTNNLVKLSQLSAARALLRANDIPVDDASVMSLVTGSIPYENSLLLDEWKRADTRGNNSAEQMYATGVIMPTLGTTILPDSNMPTPTVSTVLKYASILMHKYAIAAAYRPIAIPQGTGTVGSTINFNGIPVRSLVSWDPIGKQWLMSFDLAFGFSVLRKECACLIYSNKV